MPERAGAASCGGDYPAGSAYDGRMGDDTFSTEDSSTPQRMVPLGSVLTVAAVIVVLVVIAGFVHVVHGGTFDLCPKDGWALQDTFVDLDDYRGKPLFSLLDKAKVLRAMFACSVLQRPAALDETRPGTPGASTEVQAATAAYEAAHQSAVKTWESSLVAITKIRLTDLVKSAAKSLRSWSKANPGRACPDDTNLNAYTDSPEAMDAWGRPIKILCGDKLPPGAKGKSMALMSLGQDGQEGTEDDLIAW